jgi:hypothetical protein
MSLIYLEQLLEELESSDGKLVILQEKDGRWDAEIKDTFGQVTGHTTEPNADLLILLKEFNEVCEEVLLEDYDG